MSKSNSNSNGVKLAVLGASLAGLAASAYYFFGKDGSKHQKQVKSWALKMKAEVIGKLEQAREITEPVYHDIIDAVAREYMKGMKDNKTEVEALAADLKKHWKSISKNAIAAKEEMAKGAKNAVKKLKA